MPATYSLRCPVCGSEFLATQTRAEAVTTCPHCAHLAPLREFTASGGVILNPASALPMQRRRIKQTTLSAAEQLLMDFPSPVNIEPLPAPTQPANSETTRRGSGNPSFTPLQEAELPLPDAPGRKPQVTPAKALLALLSVASLAAVGWFINQSPESAPIETTAPKPSTAALSSSSHSSVAAASATFVEPDSSEPSKGPAALTSLTPALNDEIESVRLNSEAPEVMRALFDAPVEERYRHVQGGKRHAASLSAFFSRAEPVQPGGLRRLPVNPIDLISGQPAVLFQATTSSNKRGALTRFHRGKDGALRLDWGLFEETHDTVLERFLQSKTSEARWFHAGIRRNHGLDFKEEYRETHHVFDLQAAPGSLLGRQGVVARDLPVGRYLNQNTDWRAIYLARLLLMNKTLPDGQRILEIIDCEGAGLSRGSETVPASNLPTESQ